MGRHLKDLTGMKFGRLFVFMKFDKKNGRYRWKCKCDCGNEKIVLGESMKQNLVKSCGCLRKEHGKAWGIKCKKHGHIWIQNGKPHHSKTYNTWASMLDRCNNSNRKYYYLYGGRGITVCDEWRNFGNFLRDMGERPEGTTLDRINSDDNYEPLNCRWANCKIQIQNRRKEIYIKNLIYDTKGGFSVDITKQNNVII